MRAPDPDRPRLREEAPARFRLGAWVAEPAAGRLCQGEEAVHLEPKVMEVLLALAAAAGEVVPRERLFDLVWPDVVVTDSAINRSISDLRRVLGDDPRRPTYIETIPKVGYRLLLPAEPLPDTLGDGALGDGAGGPGLPPHVAGDGTAPPLPVPPPAVPRRRRWALAAGLALALVAVAGAVWSLRAPDFSEAVARADARVLTTLPGTERHGRISPDGASLAFVTTWPDADGPTDLYVQGLAASAPRRIAQDAVWPAWAPDGQTLAFLRRDRETGKTAIWTVTEYGTDERMLAAGDFFPAGLSWTPDGRALVVPGRATPDGPEGLVVLDVATGARRQLTDGGADHTRDFSPVVSPDGARVVFMRWVNDSSSRLFVVPIEGGEPTPITPRASAMAGAAWTPDGRSVVFSSDRSGPYRLWTAEPGGEPRRLSVPSPDPGTPSTCPAGVLAYADWRYDTNVWVGPADGTAEARPVQASALWDEEPALSPDGARLAFVSTRSGALELWVGAVAGGEPRRLTDHGGALHAPRWSPDGRTIAYQAQGPEGSDVFVVPADGGEPRRLTSHPADDVNPRWSRDGRAVLFGSERGGGWAVWHVPVAGGEARRVAPGAFVGEEDAAGGGLLVMRPGEPGLFRIGPDGSPRLVAEVAAPDWHNWASTAAGVVVLDRSGEAPRIVRHGPDRPTVLAEALGRLTPFRATLAASRDGSTVAWGRIDRAENDLVVVEGLAE